MDTWANSCRPTRYFSIAFLFFACLCAPSLNAAITITTTLPSYYSANSAIQGVAFQATGASTPLQWSISAGSLPAGLTFSAGGLFGGTPTTGGTYTFTVRAAAPQEPNNAPGTKSFTVGIPQITTTTPLPAASIGVPYSVQFQVTDGPTTGAVWSVSLGGLPIGLTMDARTGIYSGPPSRDGTFNPTISVSYGVANAVKQFSITISVSSGTLTVTPASVTINTVAGIPSDSKILTVSTTSATPVPFTVALDDGNGRAAPAGLRITPASGATPGILQLSVAFSALTPGVYQARVRVSVAGTALPPVDIPVTVIISPPPPPTITGPPVIFRFVARATAPGTFQQVFQLRNVGSSGAVPFSLAVLGKSPWIVSVSAASQTLRSDVPTDVTITVNTQGLDAGSYQDTIRVTTAVTPVFDVPILLVIAAAGANMSLSDTGVRFATIQGNQGSRTEQIFVRNIGDPRTTVNWTAQATKGADLITITNPTGSSTPGSASSFGVQLSNTAASSPGGKFALIQVTDPQFQNSPQFVVVVADVAPQGTPPVPDPDPAGLVFNATTGVATQPQQITVNTTSAAPVAFSVAASTNDGANWLAATARSSTTSQSNPAQISVSVTTGSLGAGTYTGTVNIAIGAIVRGVTVTLFLQPTATVSRPETTLATGPFAACSPASVQVAQSGLVNNFSVPAGWPATLAVQVTDNCGSALTNANVVASFSNGDPPITLKGDSQTPAYSATWQPGRASTGMTVTVDAASAKLTASEIKFGGSVDPNTRPAPTLSIGGLLNNLNPQVGAALAPGTVTQVYGDNLTDSPDQPPATPLPVSFKGVQAVIGGLASPFFYVSKGQLVVQLPSELVPKKTYSAILIAGDQYTLPQDVEVATVTPGTVAFADGTLVAQHSDSSLVSVDRPAKPGEALTIYLVGMGATTPAVPSGAATPGAPLARVTFDPKVTVDGQPAAVSFAGLTPGGVGLYQINFTVPSGAKTGNLEVIITQNDVKANITRLIVAQ